MDHSASPTIFAFASGAMVAPIAILRLSGSQSIPILRNMTKKPLAAVGQLVVRKLYNHYDGQLLDHAMVVYYQAPQSYSGEDMVELHLHGGLATKQAILEYLRLYKGVRTAEAGEFTRRAFHNGKMDLTASEAVVQLIQATTDSQRKLALQQADGSLARLLTNWRANIVTNLARLEGLIDFADDEVPSDQISLINQDILNLHQAVSNHLSQGKKSLPLWQGLRVAIIGPANAGKSSLLNHLLGYERAIVNTQPGTTRDVIEADCVIGDIPIRLADTAGFRETNDLIEQQGLRFTERQAKQADVLIIMQSCDQELQAWQSFYDEISPESPPAILPVLNKIDLIDSAASIASLPSSIVRLSLTERKGLDSFDDALKLVVTNLVGNIHEVTFNTERQHQVLQNLLNSLTYFFKDEEFALRAESLRSCLLSIGQLTGTVDFEEVLDSLFTQFCIGK